MYPKSKIENLLDSVVTPDRLVRILEVDGRFNLDEAQVASLDALGFEWVPKLNIFEERLEEVKAYKAKHGNLRVKITEEGSSLHKYCLEIRKACKNPQKRKLKLTEEGIAKLDGIEAELC